MSLVILTGVGRPGQLGEVLARRFAGDGHRVALLHRDGAAAAERAAELRALGHAATSHAVDLTDATALATLAEEIAAGAPDGIAALVAAAGGFAAGGGVADTTPDVLARMVAVNLTTAFVTTQAFLPQLRRARGAIVYVASPAALPGATGKGIAAYAAAKAGVLALMRAVAAEEAPHGVRANAVAPAAIRTAANTAAMGDDTRYVSRETVAEVVAWLCSAPGVTGQVVGVTSEE